MTSDFDFKEVSLVLLSIFGVIMGFGVSFFGLLEMEPDVLLFGLVTLLFGFGAVIVLAKEGF